jgi:uncharacterized repeat protein (TIGR01451 family)
MRRLLFTTLWLGCTALASAQTVPVDLTLETIATGLNGAVGVRHAGDGSGRRFVIRRQGRIEIIDAAGNVAATPFLDLTANAPPLGFAAIGDPEGGDERGLLGLAFHPLHASNGRVFVYYINGSSDTVVAEYAVMAGDANRLDPASARVILRIWQPATNHNGGDIHFGPDGYLYVGMGDGGGSNDSSCGAGQALNPTQLTNTGSGGACAIGGGDSFLGTPPAGVPRGNTDSRALLGKMLRIDVDLETPRAPVPAGADLCGADPTTGIANYDIPPGNPFAGDAGSDAAACDETYHYGLRNPFRWSFDRSTGDLIIGDVGQSRWEEHNLVSGSSAGLNFGWNVCEGRHVRGSTSTLCSLAGRTDPIIAYGRSSGFSTTGGYRYRGPHAALQGLLFFGDYGDQIFVGEQQMGGNWIHRSLDDDATLDISAGSVVGFGEDEAGHVYVTTLSGEIRRFALPGPLPPQMTLTKTAAFVIDSGTSGQSDPGDRIEYDVTIENTGGEALTALAVEDRFEGGTGQPLSCAPTTLAPGASATCASYQHLVTQDDFETGGALVNVASASAQDEGGDSVADDDDASVTQAPAAPQLAVAKLGVLVIDGGTTGVADLGDRVEYGVTVSNAGNVRLASLQVTDQFGAAAAQTLSCTPTLLEPGQQSSCSTYTYDVVQADIDAGQPLVNVARASATRVGGGAAIEGESTESIAVSTPAPALTLAKQATLLDGDGDGLADSGEAIRYTFTVENTGNVTLAGVAVVDPALGGVIACSPATLAPAASASSGPVDYVVVAADLQMPSVVNVAHAQGNAPNAPSVTESPTASTSTPTDQGDFVFADGFEGD